MKLYVTLGEVVLGPRWGECDTMRECMKYSKRVYGINGERVCVTGWGCIWDRDKCEKEIGYARLGENVCDPRERERENEIERDRESERTRERESGVWEGSTNPLFNFLEEQTHLFSKKSTSNKKNRCNNKKDL